MDDILTRLRPALAGQYELEHELGRGGMAVVYLARDLRHQRRVAIKVMRQDIGGSASDRFLREIQTAAQLHHPHILPLYDSGSAGELLYYVMPYVEGETLRNRIERSGPLPIEDAIRIAIDVADALEFAHSRSIVHRDIKPENIMLSAGHASVADFGIARAADVAGFKTETGVAVGTPSYMSPEQAMADPRVDGRTDQYALGCVLYEMLAGHPPFAGKSSQAIMARHTTDVVPPLATVRSVTPSVESAIIKALAKTPGDRWPSSKAFADALLNARAQQPKRHRPLMKTGSLAAFAAIVVIASWFGARRLRAGDGGDTLKLVAVLPFSAGTDTSRAALADGLAEGVSAGLVQAKLANLGVLSGERVRAYADRTSDLQQVGRELGVNAVVTASVRVIGSRIRVTPQLVDVATGRTLVQPQFDGELVVDGKVQDLWTIIDAMTTQIVATLQPALSSRERQFAARGPRTTDAEALRLYLEARRKSMSWSRQDLAQAISLFQRALARDSMYADAWMGLADAYGSSGANWLGLNSVEFALRWRSAAERALEIDTVNAEALSTRAVVKIQYDWDLTGGARDLRRAMSLAPGSPTVTMNYGWYLDWACQYDSAVYYARRSVALDPQSSVTWQQLSVRLAFAQKMDSAVAAAREALRRDSLGTPNYWVIMNTSQDAGDRAAADRIARRIFLLGAHDQPGAMAFVAHHYRRSGNRAAAKEVLDSIVAMSKRSYVIASTVGAVRLAVGDTIGALDDLERSVNNRDFGAQDDLVLHFTPLKNHPRYIAAAQKLFGGHAVPRNPFP